MANMIIMNKGEELRPVAAAYCRLTGGAKNSGRNLYKKICNWCIVIVRALGHGLGHPCCPELEPGAADRSPPERRTAQ